MNNKQIDALLRKGENEYSELAHIKRIFWFAVMK